MGPKYCSIKVTCAHDTEVNKLHFGVFVKDVMGTLLQHYSISIWLLTEIKLFIVNHLGMPKKIIIVIMRHADLHWILFLTAPK